MDIITEYGILRGATYIRYYPNGNLKECTLTQANQIETPCGKFTPQYLDDGYRRKIVKPVVFYENGKLKNLPLQEQVEIKTSVGSLSAELITWHQNGAIKRVFPLDGRLTGFWTEEDEYKLAPTFEYEFSFGKVKQKIISLQFYDNGAVKSMTFWPKETLTIQTPIGPAEARTGISLYPNGRLKAFEPADPIMVDTPIGKIKAYDTMALGVHGESTSLQFKQNGGIEGITTSTDEFTVVNQAGLEHHYGPQLKASLFDPLGTVLVPLKLRFEDNYVRFGDDPEGGYNTEKCHFIRRTVNFTKQGTCFSCEGCNACKSAMNG